MTALDGRAWQEDKYSDSYISTIGVDFVSTVYRSALATRQWPCRWCLPQLTAALPAWPCLCVRSQKIRGLDLDGKTVKLQIVSPYSPCHVANCTAGR